jgi:hypothetical protein
MLRGAEPVLQPGYHILREFRGRAVEYSVVVDSVWGVDGLEEIDIAAIDSVTITKKHILNLGLYCHVVELTWRSGIHCRRLIRDADLTAGTAAAATVSVSRPTS